MCRAIKIVALVMASVAGCSDDSTGIIVPDAPRADATLPAIDAGPDAPTPVATVRSIDLVTNALVFDRTRGLIYASVPTLATERADTVTTIDPETATVTDSLAVGENPNVLAIADDDSILYVGLDGNGSVRRVDLAAHAASTTIYLGDGINGPLIGRDIAVMPGAPRTIAVSRDNGGFRPSFVDIAIFDDAVVRPMAMDSFPVGNELEFADATTLYGYANQDGATGICGIRVDAEGAHELRTQNYVLSGLTTEYIADFVYDRGQLIGTQGQVADAMTFFASGRFAARGPVVVDPSGSPVTYLQIDDVVGLRLAAFDRERQVPISVVEVPIIVPLSPFPGVPSYGSFLRISATRFAFRGETAVYILDVPAR